MNTPPAFKSITSRDNALLKDLRSLSSDNTAYRKLARFWVEGEHLALSALARGRTPHTAVFLNPFGPVCRST